MVDEIVKLAINSGIFAALFSFLLFYVLRDSAKREKKYQETIEKLNCHLDTVNELKEDMSEIKTIITNSKISTAKKGEKKSA